MSCELRFGPWEEVLANERGDALITDAPFSERTHKGAASSEEGDPTSTGDSAERLKITYDHWTPDDVMAFVKSWSPRISGWMAILTDHVLIPAFEAAYEEVGRYHFQPVGCLVTGMGVRMLGDGPSSWMTYLMVARPRTMEYARWGTLPGGYYGPAQPGAGGGRGKPRWLMEAIMRDYSKRGTKVIDPLSGWGTTLACGRAMGRNVLGSERDRGAYTEAQRRLGLGTQYHLL